MTAPRSAGNRADASVLPEVKHGAGETFYPK
jgi:hypothetical protein